MGRGKANRVVGACRPFRRGVEGFDGSTSQCLEEVRMYACVKVCSHPHPQIGHSHELQRGGEAA